ncbi:MAG: NAD-dependent epimerase/dehydratase family protein [Vulcanimicrobiota bacterium]
MNKKRKTALIMGVCGFCGTHLAETLENVEGLDILGSDISEAPPEKLKFSDYIPLDITCQEDVIKTIKETKPDWAFNLAGLNRGDSSKVNSVNHSGAVFLLEAIKEHSPGTRVVMVGSAAEYGAVPPSMLPITESHPCNPVGHYGNSKLAMTNAAISYARDDRLKVVIARPFNVIGPGMPEGLVITDIMNRALKAFSNDGEPVIRVGNINSMRDFIAVQDVVEAYVRMIQGDYWGEVFNICSGKAYAVSTIVHQMLSLFGRPFTLEVEPSLVKTNDVDVSIGSFEKAQQAFGFEPSIHVEESIKGIWESMSSRIDSIKPSLSP